MSQRDQQARGSEDHLADAGGYAGAARGGISRRGFLGGLGGAAALGRVTLAAAPGAQAAATQPPAGTALLAGKPLRVRPALVYSFAQRREKTSWRSYGGIETAADVDAECRRIEQELQALAAQAEFPVAMLPVAKVTQPAEAEAVAGGDADVLLVYAASGDQGWLERLAASKKPNLMFLRHRSGPFYLWYETAHWRLMRKSEDALTEPNITLDDIVVDDYGEVLWRLRALYGLKNARGTKSLALGGLAAYSAPGQKEGPRHVKEVWGYDIQVVPAEKLEERLRKARTDQAVIADTQRAADELLAQPGVTLRTDKRFVVNSFLAARVFKELMAETGATNIGVANCMGSLIGLLGTPPCLVLSLLNDEGFTAFCHTDYTHTPAGVLLRWISGKPSFVCNSHFPHAGLMTLAHCAAPRRMNGRECEPVEIVTHFESDYGAATRVQYTTGQITTNIIPNLTCTKWFGFRGRIEAVPSYPICRSQMDVTIDGDWRRLLRDLQGFHTLTCYGDYLQEVGYALKKVGIAWENVSAST